MNAGAHLCMLARYTAWANEVLYDALVPVPEAMVFASRPGPLGGMAGVLGHIYVVGLIWKAHLTGQAHGFTTRRLDEPLPLADLRRRQADVDQWYIDFTEAQSDESLARDIRFQFIGGGEGVMRVDEMLLHVANHGTYHRGFVADMLYGSGGTAPTMDLPVYLRQLRATA
jgi:uncharacterized damage-inducible protein DinB